MSKEITHEWLEEQVCKGLLTKEENKEQSIYIRDQMEDGNDFYRVENKICTVYKTVR